MNISRLWNTIVDRALQRHLRKKNNNRRQGGQGMYKSEISVSSDNEQCVRHV